MNAETQRLGEQQRNDLAATAAGVEADERSGGSVGDVMTPDPIVVAPEDTIGEVAEKLSRADVGSALVGEYGRLIGIITSRDMLHVLAGRVHSSEARVRQWMTAEPIVVSPTTAVDEARAIMVEHRIHHLPVVDGGRLVGVIGLRDVVESEHAPMPLGLGF